jgi:hypothetical protein
VRGFEIEAGNICVKPGVECMLEDGAGAVEGIELAGGLGAIIKSEGMWWPETNE